LNRPDLTALPGLPRDAEGPVFAEPWQAEAFAMTVSLHQAGAFSWRDWAQTLAEELAGDPQDDGSRYYEHWLAALERLVTARGLALEASLAARKAAWAQAYRSTPHGQSVAL
jgi:nitrile hydratase accessory protein